MKQTVKTGIVLATLLTLALLACFPQSEGEIQEEIEEVIDRERTYAQETADAEWAAAVEATARARRLDSGVTFLCAAPANSYLHRRLDIDLGYEESWSYSIHIDPSTNSFQLSHEAYSDRTLEGGCKDIFVWTAQESGEVDEQIRLDATITLNQRMILSCEADEAHPAVEETREDVYQWWLISSEPFYDNGWKINTCTCNAGAHELTAADFEQFQSTGVCPPCIHGAMICVEE